MLKADLEVRAKALGVAVRGNMLKSEIVGLITYAEAAAKAKEPTPQVTGSASEAPATPDPTPAGTETPATTSPSTGESSPKEGSDPWVPASGVTPSGTSSSATGTQEKPASPVTTPSDESAEAAVTDKLGGTVISEEPADTPGEQSVTPPTEVAKPSAPTGPSACADCGVDLAADRADPVKKNAVRLSYVKFRRYLCAACLQQSTT
jgi:hypothetical protein